MVVEVGKLVDHLLAGNLSTQSLLEVSDPKFIKNFACNQLVQSIAQIKKKYNFVVEESRCVMPVENRLQGILGKIEMLSLESSVSDLDLAFLREWSDKVLYWAAKIYDDKLREDSVKVIIKDIGQSLNIIESVLNTCRGTKS